MKGHKVGGINVFGGGLALYNEAGELVGAIGVSGDTSPVPIIMLPGVRAEPGLDFVPGGVNTNGNDGIIYDSTNNFAHPFCLGSEHDVAVSIGAGTPAAALAP